MNELWLKKWRTVRKELTRLLHEFNEVNQEDTPVLYEEVLSMKEQIERLHIEITRKYAQQWWSQIPTEDIRRLRVLLIGRPISPSVIHRRPDLSYLMLLLDLEDPNVIRIWAEMTEEKRKKTLDDLALLTKLSDEESQTENSWQKQEEVDTLAYAVLGLTSSATWQEIRQAYRDAVRRVHPDAGGDPARFRHIQLAYEHLTKIRKP
ncbi:hypothetical protein DNHGIG_17850 [Collibacillus ludicampi]|uniref:J domain-containing protein n=1 Tax=Collibacillus ludicampi TaxID=2771369 RepID=A0AAV4LEJ3_9BACL|nr:J domain-containing protein [Collibacillus ludicampi]GIM46236.1 hypothetical protein DNHGIG_17850 [Collibacillus ludicampi]